MAKIKIRNSVFETNSSSIHSICITKNNDSVVLPEKIFFVGRDFGWEQDIYYDTESKAAYLYTAILQLGKYNIIDEGKSIQFIANVLMKNNVDYEFVKSEDEFYIDHVNELTEFVASVCHSERRLLRYLFCAESFIVTGNDNTDDYFEKSCPPVTYKHEEYYKGN